MDYETLTVERDGAVMTVRMTEASMKALRRDTEAVRCFHL